MEPRVKEGRRNFETSALASGIPAAPAPCSLLLEGADAALTGMTRSLHRRLSGLNLPAWQAPVTALTINSSATSAASTLSEKKSEVIPAAA